jgi:hypothetical protein
MNRKNFIKTTGIAGAFSLLPETYETEPQAFKAMFALEG